MIQRLNAALTGRYRVEREVGQGGMATVFLAHDLRHDRPVALKVLKPELGAVVGGERFLAEIRTTANLQHPHILPLFDSGEVDGLIFYVMPYVEGESLQDRLDREGQLPVDEAVAIATKVLAALGHAHEAGVVHRDVKPANVLLAGGEPQVADFGIALAVTQAGDGRITETGLTLGTPHYMSPEQATGDRAVDPRSDLYSLSCVLYEMFAGQPPFVAASAQAVLAKLLTEDAPDVRKHRRSVPEHVAAAVATGLERLPADRFQTARDFMAALTSPGPHGRFGRRAAEAPSSGRGGPLSRVSALAGWGLAALLAIAWLVRPEPAPPAPAPPILFTLPAEDGSVDVFTRPALAPDESSIVFAARGDGESGLRLHRLETGATEVLSGTDGARAPFFSADGRRVGYFVGDALRFVDLESGEVDELTRDPAVGRFEQRGIWLDDGSIILDHNENEELWALPAGTFRPVRLAGAEEWDGLAGYTVSSISARLPGGHGLVTAWDGDDRPVPVLVTPATGELRRLEGDAARGVVVAAWADTVVLGRRDPATLQFLSVDVEAGVGRRAGPPLVPPPSWLPGDGIGPRVTTASLATAEGDQGIVAVDRQGTRRPLNLRRSTWEYPRISPSGDRLLLTEYARGLVEKQQVVLDLQTGATTPLPAGDEHAWSHDGVYVYWNRWNSDAEGPAIIRHRADGTGRPEPITPGLDGPPWVTSASPDGRTLLFYGEGIQELDLGSGEIRVLIDDDGVERNGMFSPDGRYIAYSAQVGGREVVYVKPYPELDRRWTISPGRGQLPMWSPDGDELFYVDGDRVYAVAMGVSGDGELQPGPPELLFDQPFYRNDLGDQSYDVAPDGSFIMVEGVRRAAVAVQVNWRSVLSEASSRGGGG